MKKAFLCCFVCVLVLFCGCDNSSDNDEDTYFVEAGRIPNSAYNSALSKMENYSSYYDLHAYIKSIRYDLKEKTVGDYEYKEGVSIDEIRDFLKEHSDNPLDVKDNLSFLEEVGNTIIFFNLKKEAGMNYNPDDYKVYMYAEKE